MPKSAGYDHWKMRRRVFSLTIFLAAALIAYVTWKWEDIRIAETLVLGAFSLWGAVVAAYAGFATWEDIKNPELRDRPPRPDHRQEEVRYFVGSPPPPPKQ